MNSISILGATGSIGTQALSVVRQSNDLRIVGASCEKNINSLKEAVMEFDIPNVSVRDENDAIELQRFFDKNGKNVKVFHGEEGLLKLAALKEADIVLTSVVGLSGLAPTVEAIKNKKNIALANKETLVAAGEIIMEMAKEYGVKILPVDSEHSAIFQSLQGSDMSEIKNIILTASGGPFRGKDKDFIRNATLEMALNHPTWNMGKKVTIDSASLLNKGLEMIEAKWLFNVKPENIIVHVHKESILHSAVEFKDNSVIAQLGAPDMRLPIQYAFNYPKRLDAVAKKLNLFETGTLSFEKPDMETFGCLKLAYVAAEKGGFYPLIYNTADEVAVDMLLKEEIMFYQIQDIIEFAFKEFGNFKDEFTLENIFILDKEIRNNLRDRFLNRK